MARTDWQSVFDEVHVEAGASHQELEQLVATIFAPVSAAEASSINADQFGIDPSKWIFPKQSLPQSYLELLQWSNGPECRSGEREFGFFPATGSTTGIRAMMLAYHVPEYMPFAVPFAFNGGGTFYMFDMRQPPVDGEYPILCCGSGALGFDDDDFVKIADSLYEACIGRGNVDSLRFPETEELFVDLVLTQQLPLKQLVTLNKLFKLSDSVAQLKKQFSEVPATFAQLNLENARSLLENHTELLDCIQAHDQEKSDIIYSLKNE